MPIKNPSGRGILWPLSIAPMMDWTDRHYRFFMRLITRHTLLYTEMKTTGAILNGDREKILSYSPLEKPLALQIGGDDPGEMAASAKIAAELGYDEVNINVGCPSERVQRGNFGACLMSEPEIVARGVAEMRDAVDLPVTVKCRIGIDHYDSWDFLHAFADRVAAAGCDRLIVHARIAWLKGLNPKQNRTIPPLRYEDVYRLKQEIAIPVEINGGIKTLDAAAAHLDRVDGVMVGRAAYENPYIFVHADRQLFGDRHAIPSRRMIVQAMMPYLENAMNAGHYPNSVLRHMLGLFAFKPGNKAFRRYISENHHKSGITADILRRAMEQVPGEVLDERSLASKMVSQVY